MITIARARKLREMIVKASASLQDEDALEAVELYAIWKPDTEYHTDDRVRDDETLYRCVQAHTSQDDWRPAITPALWTIVTLDEWPEWVQPIGTQDAYPLGAKVTHNGQRWVSLYDNNVWEPGTFGWQLYED